jgi:glyoxylase-like metal-dependent hydrolase (beta-lactamase superfamily II)
MYIHPNIFLFSGMISNCYLLSDSDSLSIIDCGVSRDANKILKRLTELGYPEKPLKNIFITHADGDHYGSASKIHDYTQARIFSSPIEKEAIEIGGSSRPLKGNRFVMFLTNLLNPLFAASPVSVNETLSYSQVLPILTGMQVLETPGHTPGHVSFWLEEPHILFAGDSIRESSGKPIASAGMNTWDLELSKRSFDLQMDLHPKIICAGHTCLLLK